MKTIISVYDSKEADFTHNGLVVLNNCKSCLISDELNKDYGLEIEYPISDDGKWQYLLENNIIKADGQLFRINHKLKTSTKIIVDCMHIFYDLKDNLLDDVRPENLSGVAALDWVLTHTAYSHPFTATGDLGGSNTKYFVRKNPIDAILGTDGIIANWNGEIKRDNFSIGLYNNIGEDHQVLIAYGKNITGIEETLDIDGIVTRIMPLGKDGLLLTEKYIDSLYINNFPHPKIKVVEFKDIDNEDDLRAAGQNYFTETKCDIPIANYKIDFIPLSKTEEYKNYQILETVNLGDTVTIRHSRLNINLKAKVIKTVKNVLTDRLEKIELGSFKKTITSDISNGVQNAKDDVENAKSDMQTAIEDVTDLINTALNGVTVVEHNQILIMDTDDKMTAQNVWKWSLGGLGFSSTGVNGDYKTAITADGHIVANFVDTGILNAMIIKTGLLKSADSTSWLNLDNGTFNFGNGKLIFNGTNFELDYSGTELASNLDGINGNLDTINNFIRFVDGNIILGETGNAITLKIQNDRISFITGQDDLGNDIEVAYFSNNKLFIMDAEIVNSIKIGTFAFVPASNGNLNFKKVV